VISLSDRRLEAVMQAASHVPVEKRSVFLQRIAGVLRLQAGRYGDADVEHAVERALQGADPGVGCLSSESPPDSSPRMDGLPTRLSAHRL
jgi:hypothetical protein